MYLGVRSSSISGLGWIISIITGWDPLTCSLQSVWMTFPRNSVTVKLVVWWERTLSTTLENSHLPRVVPYGFVVGPKPHPQLPYRFSLHSFVGLTNKMAAVRAGNRCFFYNGRGNMSKFQGVYKPV